MDPVGSVISRSYILGIMRCMVSGQSYWPHDMDGWRGRIRCVVMTGSVTPVVLYGVISCSPKSIPDAQTGWSFNY